MKVVAFDIDGTLTEPEGMELFRELSGRKEIFVGVISRRRPSKAVEFIKENNLQINFEEMGFIKTIPLLQQKAGFFLVADEFIYIGNRTMDRIASAVTMWRFVHIDDAPQILRDELL